jgi:methionine synthase II (cobalamin-independent)
MLIQFNQGLPGITTSGQKVYFDTEAPGFNDAVSHFYENYLAATENRSSQHLELFSLTPAYAEGFGTLVEALGQNPGSLTAIKGQVTGPFTLATSLTDEKGKSAFYNPQLRDIVVKTLALKAVWQIQKLHPFGVPVIISLDEPSLVGFGSSAFLGITAEEVQKDLKEIISLIHNENAYVAVHCCENTDWSMLLSADIDILSFDAYSYFEKLLLYAEPLKAFIDRGGILAWGLVPTSHSEHIQNETKDSLTEKWESHMELLTQKGADAARAIEQSLITPSCGAGSLTPDEALRVLLLLQEVSGELRRRHLK